MVRFDNLMTLHYRRNSEEDFMRNVLACAIILAVTTAASCSRGINSRSAVERAIEAHLERNSSLALNAFTTEISDVKFEGENAEAVVQFKSKQAPHMSVQVRYTLRKEGDHWVVQSSSAMGGGPHSGGMPQSQDQGANPHEELGRPAAHPPSSEPQPMPSH
jgi:hypothetical protein